MHTTQAGIDIAKTVFEVALSDTPGEVHERHRLSRERFRRFFSKRETTTVLMEACGSAHYWGRELQAMGHQVRLLHPGDVARYRDGNKTDRADAKAVLEAARNAAIDPVPVKSREQQAIATLHRLRQGYMQTRTARINAVRGHLREFGIVIPVGARHVVARAESALETEELPDFLRRALRDVLDEIERLQVKAEQLRSVLERLARAMPEATLLLSVPGVGVLTATALVAFVGDLNRFGSGRELAASSLSPTNSPASAGEYGATKDPLNEGRPPNPQSSCTAKTPMAHRSDRRGDAPITNVSSSGTGKR
jgi:transposase